jgi:hypothetical protein
MLKHYVTSNIPPFCWGHLAITLFPLGIFYRSKEHRDNEIIRNHELIHWKQQKEMLCLLFYLWYLVEYLIKLIRFMDHRKAYRGIGFEREAKKYEIDAEYLSKRKTFHWIRFVIN